MTVANGGAWKPRFSVKGEIAYLRMVTAYEKNQLVDLAIRDASEERSILVRRQVTDFAWSTDGSLLAVGELTDRGRRLTIVDLATGDINEIEIRSQ